MSVVSPDPHTPAAPSASSLAVGDLLGAHVSIRGGVERAPERAEAIGAEAIQLFTKTPNRWHEPPINDETAARFREAVARQRLRALVAHDSYLINLASPDPKLRSRSIKSLVAELERCHALGIPFLVSHPGNYIDDRDLGLVRNAEACTAALDQADSATVILLETTAGTGTALGSNFEELSRLRSLIEGSHDGRIGICLDTCHVFAAGYDLVHDFDSVIAQLDSAVGLEWLRCLHLNDSKFGLASRRDRHEEIGHGMLGEGPFRRIMQDPRLAGTVKILETPKGEDETTNDRRALALLRGWATPPNRWRSGSARRHR